jgi:addiction module RelE/StbE family toxin
MRRLEWTGPAVEDLREIKDYIARDSRLYADAAVERIILACEDLPRFPKRGRIVPEVGDPNLRELIVQAYRVVYRIKPKRIQILTVLHGAREFPKTRI